MKKSEAIRWMIIINPKHPKYYIDKVKTEFQDKLKGFLTKLEKNVKEEVHFIPS